MFTINIQACSRKGVVAFIYRSESCSHNPTNQFGSSIAIEEVRLELEHHGDHFLEVILLQQNGVQA